MALVKQLLQTWKAQLQAWARTGDLLEASGRSLQLNKPSKRLLNWIESVKSEDNFELPHIELLSNQAMRGAVGAYASSTKTIYLNQNWLKTAKEKNVVTVLNEELGHFLDDQYNKSDTPGDEGRVFSQLLLHCKNADDRNNVSKLADQGLIRVSGKWIEAELQNWTGIPGGDKYPNASDGDDNSGNDSLNGGTGNDTINGGNGKDTIHGQKGDDSIEGGDGNDSLHGGNQKDTISGGKGNDVIKLENSGYSAHGGNGNDTIHGGSHVDSIDGGEGQDSIIGYNNNDTINGNSGDDIIKAGNGNDEINGGDGNDKIEGQNHQDLINGDSGNDTIHGGHGNDEIHGGEDNDSIKAGKGNDQINGDSGNDIIRGEKGHDLIDGGFGDDRIIGHNSNDTITGGPGNDTINGGNGSDKAIFSGNRCDYTINFSNPSAPLNENIITVSGPDGTDKITLVEELEFDDVPSIKNVNTSPTSSHNTKSIKEDTPTTLDDDDFGSFKDTDCHTLQSVKITSLQDTGKLEFDSTGTGDWADVNLNDEITTDELNAGRLKFTPIKDEHGDGYTTIGFKVGDGDLLSENAYSLTINVEAINDDPILDNADGTLAFTEGDGPSVLDASLSLSDVDDNTIESARISITDNYQSAEDVLGFIDQNNISGTYNSATGVLSLSGSDSRENYKSALESVTYNNISSNPTTTARTISWLVNDGTNSSTPISTTVTLNTINNRPVLGNAGGTLAFTEDDGPSVLDASLSLSDDDDNTIESASISIADNFQSAEDVLGFIDQNNISGSYNSATGVLSLSGLDSHENYKTALESVTYNNISSNPTTTSRTISWLVNDGIDSSAPISTTVTLNTINNRPVIGKGVSTLIFTEGDGPSVLDASLNFNDVDNSSIESASIQISANHQATQDVLGFIDQNNISGSYNSVTGMLSLSGSDSLENYRTALASITYNNISENPITTARTITWLVNDGTDSSRPINTSVTLNAINDRPVLGNTGGTLAFTEGDGPSILDPSMSLSDVDHGTIESANLRISANYNAAEDVLGFIDQNNISGVFDKTTGVLSLSGSDSLANYRSALASITYNNISDHPTTAPRTISWLVNDGADSSTPINTTVTITAVKTPASSSDPSPAQDPLPSPDSKPVDQKLPNRPGKNQPKSEPTLPDSTPEAVRPSSESLEEQEPKTPDKSNHMETIPHPTKIDHRPDHASDQNPSLTLEITPLKATIQGDFYHLNRNASKGTSILDFNHTLTQKDQDENGEKIRYSIISGNDQKLFSINRKGILSLNKTIRSNALNKHVRSIMISGKQANRQKPILIQANIIFSDANYSESDNCNANNKFKTNNNKSFGSACQEIWMGNEKNEWIHGKAGEDLLRGRGGQDIIHGGHDDDTIYGGDGKDQLIGNRGTDHLFGRHRDDIMQGSKQDDKLNGGRGNDTLHGGPGQDTLRGGQGNDILRGGRQADLFHLSVGRDRILDFKPSHGDRIAISPRFQLKMLQQGDDLLLLDSTNNIHTILLNTSRDDLLDHQPNLI